MQHGEVHIKLGESSMRQRIALFLVCMLALWVGTAQLMAQTETGQIAGTVADPSGASVPGATVTVRSVGTGSVRTQPSDSAGVFSITNLQPGIYEVTVTASGFATFKQNVEVVVGSKSGVDVKLEVGKSETVVEVAANAVTVNTETQTISQDISTRQVLELPSITRNPYAFVVTSGNVSEDDPSGRGVGVAINGLRSAGTNITLDGVSNNDEFTASVGQAVPLDSVEEYSIITNNFGAEFGRASAGVVNVATKSGTNDFHGTLYEFNRVSDLASNSFNNNAYDISKPHYTRNQFGYSIGGPVKKDKLFFFSNTEWTRVRSVANNVVLVPDPAFIGAAAPATQAVFSSFGKLSPNSNVIGSFSRNGFTNAFGSDPCAGSSASGGCQAYNPNSPLFDLVNYTFPSDSGAGVPQNTWNTVDRVDYNLSDRTQIYGRYAGYNEMDFAGSVSSSPYNGYNTGEPIFNQSIIASVTHTFSPRFVSQSKADFNRFNLAQPLGTAGDVPGFYFSAANTASTLGPYNIALPGYLPFAPGSAIPFGGPQNFFQVYQDFSFTKGKHQIRFGGSATQLRDDRSFGAYEEAVEQIGSSTGNGIDNFLSGQLHQFQAAVNPQGKFPCIGGVVTPQCTVTLPVGPPNFSRSNRYNEGALYVQDSWKVSHNFTLNYGLRWEYFGAQHDKNQALDSNFYPSTTNSTFQYNNLSAFIPQIINGQALLTSQSSIGQLWKPSLTNFGPRIGFAYDPFGDGKTSIRGGYAIGYERNFGNVTFNVIQNPPNYAVVALLASDVGGNLPITTDNAGPLAGSTGSKPLPRTSLRAVDPSIPQSYAHLFSVSVERDITKTQHLEVDYSGSIGESLYDISGVNIPGAGNIYGGIPCNPGDSLTGGPSPCFARLNNQYTSINFRGGFGHSDYNAMNFRYDIQDISRTGLTLRLNYTWSHATDDLSDTFSSSFNQFNLGYTNPYDPSFDKGDSQFDNRHRIAISAIWDVPLARHMTGAAKYILDGWEVAPIFTARTGAPYTVYDLTNWSGAGNIPRVITNQAVPSQTGNAGRAYTGPNTYNVFDFTNVPVNDTYVSPLTGDTDWGPYLAQETGRDAFRNFGTWNLDAGLYKNTKITERFSLQLRLEAYNVFNHANFQTNTSAAYVVAPNQGVAPFITGGYGYNPLTASFGGNRNVQLGIKLRF